MQIGRILGICQQSSSQDQVLRRTRTLLLLTYLRVCVCVCLYGVQLTFLLGADHIVLYDYNTSPATHKLVQHYAARCRDQRRCLVSVLDWRLPDMVAKGIWYNAQSLAIHDCLYRQMASSRYVVFSDIDEFLVPHRQHLTNWSQLARRLELPRNIGFKFLSAFFAPSSKPPVNGGSVGGPQKPDLMTMRSTKRTLHFSTIRTKCMVQPYDVFEAGIHHISKPIWAHLTVENIDSDTAMIHHYRVCADMYGMNCAGVVDDTAILRYSDNLTTSVVDVWKDLVNVL